MSHAIASHRTAVAARTTPGPRSGMLGRVADRDSDLTAPAPAPTAEQLLTLVGAGDREAFGDLYDQTAPRVFGLVRRLVVDPAQAEEVTQDVYLEIWQTAPRFDASRGNALAWMFTLAHRRAVDRIRASQAARDRDLRIGVRDLDVPVDTVAEAVEIRVEHERVVDALGGLSELQRECVSLAYYGGLTQSEIADRLDVPLGTVKTRLRDGMIRLRTALGVTT
ncbi:RNA polymerase sigma-70 factor (ECF subfamily) [Agromyces hippuratus]|uniref:RNA polymerase sigma-70 factor (ECF subfamily) n=2 Tax=Agromyces hippuratus TaxID=286438 RepID=A0A852WSW7_9MICO|nr:ECF RNA polymerase sigma factor SigK [Agromyces hippuratus]NYG20797.1 RNA polymerase sigma-70 factor (ECF subfamily) [Agromyces hippuratus]